MSVEQAEKKSLEIDVFRLDRPVLTGFMIAFGFSLFGLIVACLYGFLFTIYSVMHHG